VTAESGLLANLRQREAVDTAAHALLRARHTLEAGGSEELLAVDLVEAVSALGLLTGDDVREDVISEIFARFCVGK
jgi:tRNA modification GTPase